MERYKTHYGDKPLLPTETKQRPTTQWAYVMKAEIKGMMKQLF